MRAHRVLTVLFTIAVLHLCGTPSACAQGTNRSFADPIDSDGLAALARRLDLSPAQRSAVDLEHAAYLERFRVVREGPIAAYLERTGDLTRSLLYAADPDTLRRNLQEIERIRDALRAVDAGFFDAVRTVLTDPQTDALVRTQQARTRDRVSKGIVQYAGFSNRAALTDLTSILTLVALTDETRDTLDPMLAGYEAQRTSGLDRLEDVILSSLRATARRADRLAADRGGNRNWRRASMRQALLEESGPVFAQAATLSQLGVRTGRQIIALLPPGDRVDFREAWYRVAYPPVTKDLFTILRMHDTVLRTQDLDEDVRTAVSGLRAALDARLARITGEMIDVVEERSRNASWYGMTVPRTRDDRSRLSALRAERDETNDAAWEQLNTLLGNRLDAIVRAAPAVTAQVETGWPGAIVVAAEPAPASAPAGARRRTTAALVPPDGAANGADLWLPGPISTDDVARWAGRLDLGPDACALLETLHDDYRQRWDAAEAEHLPAIDAYARTAWSLDDASGRLVPPSLEAIEDVFARRRTAFATLTALDDCFFEDVALVAVRETEVPRVERLRLERRRAALARMPERGRSVGPAGRLARAGGAQAAQCRACRVDLERLVLALDLAPDDADAVAGVLDAYAPSAVDALRARRDAGLAAECALEQLGTAIAGQREPGQRAAFAAVIASQRTVIAQTSAAYDATEAALDTLNRSTLDALRATLSADAGRALAAAFRGATHPEIFDDSGSAGRVLHAALDLDGLAEAQRIEISELLLEFNDPYATLSTQMADAVDARDALKKSGRRDWRSERTLANEHERLKFERTELSRRTVRRLRSILAPEQASRLGIADDPADSAGSGGP